MQETAERELLEKGWKTARLISAAIFITPVIYYYISTLIDTSRINFREAGIPAETYKMVFLGLSIAALFAAYYIRRYGPGIRANDIIARFLDSSGTASSHPATARYTAAVIISLAISETIAIFGLIHLIINGDRFGFYQFLLLSFIAMIYYRPRKDEMLELAEKIDGKSIS